MSEQPEPGIRWPLWGWTTLGATSEVVFQILPVSLGWRHTIDAGLARTLFSITLHAIVYF